MLFEILFTFFILISLISSILLFYAMRRINFMEDIIIEFQSIIKYSSNKLKLVDNSGHFESDDEIGFIFDEIKHLQSMLDGLFETEIQDNVNDSIYVNKIEEENGEVERTKTKKE